MYKKQTKMRQKASRRKEVEGQVQEMHVETDANNSQT